MLISTNFLAIRIAALISNMIISAIVVLMIGLWITTNPTIMVGAGLFVSSFIGSFNVLEPKAVELGIQEAKRYYEAAAKLLKND